MSLGLFYFNCFNLTWAIHGSLNRSVGTQLKATILPPSIANSSGVKERGLWVLPSIRAWPELMTHFLWRYRASIPPWICDWEWLCLAQVLFHSPWPYFTTLTFLLPLLPLREVVIQIRLRLRGHLPLVLSALHSHESLLPHLSLGREASGFQIIAPLGIIVLLGVTGYSFSLSSLLSHTLLSST